jgi:PAS domain S-box-containing protein
MTKKPDMDAAQLRQRAESLLPASRTTLPHADMQKLIHELEVHQIELELQNEELRKSRLEAETNLERYTELYDFAPVGYLTLDREGVIRQANLTAATLLGIERGKLGGQHLGSLFADLPAFNAFLHKVFKSQVKESCEMILSGTDVTRRIVRIEATLAESGQACRAMLTDISESRLLQERLDRFVRFSMDQVAQAAYLIGADGRIEDINETVSRMLGYSRAELLGLPLWKIEPDLRPETWSGHWHDLQEQGSMTYETLHQGKAGQAFPVEIDVTALSYRGVDYCCALVRDITRQKEAEAALKKSHAQLHTFIEQAPISIAMLDRNMNYISTSDRWIAEYGRGHSKLIGRNHYQIHPDIPDQWKKIHRDALDGAFLRNDEDLWTQADGSKHWLRWAVYPWTDETGEIGGIIISAEDITRQKISEEALRGSEQRLSGLINSAMDAIIAVDAKQRIVLFNPAAELMFGLAGREIIGQPLDRLLPQSARDVHTAHIHAFGRTGVTSRSMKSLGTLHGLRANGEEFPIEASISQVDLSSGKLFTVILRDITERKRAEESLRASEAQFRAVFDASSVGMCHADPATGRLTRVNRRFCEMMGYSDVELQRRTFLEITHPDDRADSFEEYSRLVRGEIPEYRGEKRYVCMDGSVIWADVTVNLLHDMNLRPLRTIAVIQDITERKYAEEELRASEERYRSLVEQASDGIFVSDNQGHYIDVNTAGCRMLGYTRDELLGLSIADVIMPEEVPRIGEEVARFANNAVITSEWQFRRKDGSSFPGEVHGRQLPDGRLQAILHDITERRLAEQAMRKSAADLNRAQVVGHIGSWRLDVTRNELTWSAENHRIFGIPEGTPLTYETFLSSVHPDDRAYVDREWRASLQGKPYDIEHRVLVNGKVRWVREKAELEFDEEGKLLGGFGTTQDITERKEAEQKLQLQLRLTKAITDCAADSIFVTDRQGQVTFVNAEVERAFGYTEAALRGKVLHDVIHHHHPDGRPYPFGECPNCLIYSTGDSVRHHEAVFFARDGTPITVACSNAPLDIDGEPIGAVLVAHDISTLKRSETALLEADQRKNEFLALLAHELRNPMAVTATAAYLLQTKGLTDPEICRWATTTITNQTELLKRLVDDLLDVERVARGRVALLKTQLDLGRLIARVVKERESLIARRKQHFSYALPARSVWIEGDPARVTQIITNLLDNASKFTPEDGQIDLSLTCDGDEAVIRVRDNGRGIPPQLLPHIFEIFTQGQVSIARDEGGLGLGLALVKGLAELHGGHVTASSAGVNRGAEFIVRLPLLARVEPAPSEPIAPKLIAPRKRRILIGEDNAIAAEGLEHVLKDAGHDVRLAPNGAEALAAATEAPPEIGIFDIGLPLMDGFELARRLRKLPKGNELLLIALTGYGQEKDRIQSKEAGFDYHLVKPADLRQLLEIINNWSPAEHP